MSDYFYSLEETIYNGLFDHFGNQDTDYIWPVWMYTLLANENNQ